MSERIVIYGAGGFAREVAWLAEDVRGADSVACFVDDAPDRAERVNDVPVRSLAQAAALARGAAFVAAIGAPAARRDAAARAEAAGLVPVTLVHPTVVRSRWVTIGEGSVVCAGTILTTNVTLGRHVQVNLDCTLGHDVVLDDFATLAPGVHVSGWVTIGHGAYVGTGAVILNGTSDSPILIGEGAVVGAGACVTKSVPAGVTVVGVPARAR